jgi:NADH-quinone oxidoreductase subunit A
MASYLPLGILLIIALIIVPMTMAIGKFLRPKRFEISKLQPYECGIEITDSPKGNMSVHFYIVAVVFLVFDVETVFLFPWALAFDKLGLFGFIEVGIFLLLLIAAYIYAWLKGALRWEE